LTRALAGVRSVTRRGDAPDGVYAYDVARRGRVPVVVAWSQGRPQEPGAGVQTELCVPWRGGARAWDIHGDRRAVRVTDRQACLAVNADPVFLSRA
jgi:hypothetical protein